MFLCDNSVIYYSWFDYSLTDACLLRAIQKWSKRRKIFAYRFTRISYLERTLEKREKNLAYQSKCIFMFEEHFKNEFYVYS